MEEEIIQKIYKLTNELASQQQSNQDLATTLNGQLTDLKVLYIDHVIEFSVTHFFVSKGCSSKVIY